MAILPNRSWPGWIARTTGSIAVWLGSGAVGFSQAAASAPKPPDPTALEVVQWALSGSDPAALIAAIASALGFVASVYQLASPKPYSSAQGKKDREHQNKSFATADARQGTHHREYMVGHHLTQVGLAELTAQIAALSAQVAQTNPQAAGPMTEALTELAQSEAGSDVAIAREAVAGDYAGAYDSLIAEAEADKLRTAERYRQAARLIAPFSPSKALAAYKEATELDPEDLWSWIELGRLRAQYDTLASARNCFRNALQRVADERDRMVLHGEFGDILISEGQLGEARQEFAAGLAIAERFAAAEPGNAQWQRDLSVGFNKLGDGEVAAGNLAAARQRFAVGLAIAARLAAAEPGNAEWQRDLSVSYERLGDVEVAAGNLAAARKHFEAGFAIRERLAAVEPGNAGLQRDLFVSNVKLGDVEVAAGDLAAARGRFEASLAIRERLAAAEPGNAGWQRDLSISHNKLGDVEVAAGNLAAARKRFEADLAIAARLATAEPGNAEWQRDLYVSNAKLAQLAEAEGDAAAALGRYGQGEAVIAALAGKWPDHPGFARDLANVRADIARLVGAG